MTAMEANRVDSQPEDSGLRRLSHFMRIGLMVSFIFATASRHDAEIVTSDVDFDGLPGVTLIR